MVGGLGVVASAQKIPPMLQGLKTRQIGGRGGWGGAVGGVGATERDRAPLCRDAGLRPPHADEGDGRRILRPDATFVFRQPYFNRLTRRACWRCATDGQEGASLIPGERQIAQRGGGRPRPRGPH